MPISLENSAITLPQGLKLERFSGQQKFDLLREIEALRVRVWRASDFPMKAGHEQDTHWGDDWDKTCTHFAILNGGKVIAATRVTTHGSIADTPYPDWFDQIRPEPSPPLLYISRLVVDTDFQRQGLSDFLDARSIELGRELNAGAVLCDVPEYRVAPLLRRGFTLTSEPKLGVLFPTMRFSGMMYRLKG